MKGVCFVSVSDAWLAKLGYARHEVLGRPSTDFLTEESRERAIRDVIPEFFMVGRIDNARYQMLKKDGGIVDVLMSGVLADDPSGRGRISLAVVTDITPLLETERSLAESEARYRNLVEDQSELVSLATPEGIFQFVNCAYASIYGLLPEEIIGRSLLTFVPEEDRDDVSEHLRNVCASSSKIEIVNRIVFPNGERRWFSWTNRALIDAEGVTVIHSVGRDIQLRVDGERRLHESEARYRFLAENSTDMILLVDGSGRRIFASPASRRLLGFEPEEVLSLRLQDTIHPEDARHVLSVLQNDPGDTLFTYRMRRKDGGYVWVETTGRAVEAPDGERQRLIIVRDVSARKSAEDRLAEAHARLEILSSQDSLTGLANRRAFDEALEGEFRLSQSEDRNVALIMIDVDRFKSFNDRLGHIAGDACLRRIASAISKSVQRPGDVAARYGGEEFAVVLPNTDEAGAMTVAANILSAVRGLEIRHDESEWGFATVSLGVAALKPCLWDDAIDLLVREADRALYRAKDSGRNCVVAASMAKVTNGDAIVAPAPLSPVKSQRFHARQSALRRMTPRS